jgi:hypothetical protein
VYFSGWGRGSEKLEKTANRSVVPLIIMTAGAT